MKTNFGLDWTDAAIAFGSLALGPLGIPIATAAITGRKAIDRAADGKPIIPTTSEIFGPGEVEEINQFMRTRPLSQAESFVIKDEFFRFYDPASSQEKETKEFLDMARNFKRRIQESEGLILVEKKPFFPSWVKPAAIGVGILGVGVGVVKIVSGFSPLALAARFR